MGTQSKPAMADDKIVVAVVGRFQIGKSSLINCLLGRREAKVGNGWKSETPTCADYTLASDLVIIDTPGVDDNAARDKDAEDAIGRAHCILFVKDNLKAPGELEAQWVDAVRGLDKPCVFVCNCMEGSQNQTQHWNPESDFNVSFCKNIQDVFLEKNGFDMFMQIGTSRVLTVNTCWAQYGLGLLNDEELTVDVERTMTKRFGSRTGDYRKEALELSNIGILRNFIGNIRMELLAHTFNRKDQILRCFTDRFCEEFAKRFQSKESK